MTRAEYDVAFSRGVLVALSIVDSAREDNLYNEIVEACGPRALIRAAQGEDFDMAHLQKHGWATRGGHLKKSRVRAGGEK